MIFEQSFISCQHDGHYLQNRCWETVLIKSSRYHVWWIWMAQCLWWGIFYAFSFVVKPYWLSSCLRCHLQWLPHAKSINYRNIYLSNFHPDSSNHLRLHFTAWGPFIFTPQNHPNFVDFLKEANNLPWHRVSAQKTPLRPLNHYSPIRTHSSRT